MLTEKNSHNISFDPTKLHQVVEVKFWNKNLTLILSSVGRLRKNWVDSKTQAGLYAYGH